MKWLPLTLCCLLQFRVDAANHLIAWGGTNYGLLNLPAGVSNLTQLAAGGTHVLLLADGTIRAWGNNGLAQASVPSDLTGVVAVAAGGNHSMALMADGAVRAWGENAYNQCSVPADLRANAIAGGGTFSAAIKSDGTLAVWGYTLNNPPVPPEFTNLIKVAAGNAHVLAQRADGQVLSWGGWPLMPPPPEATNVTAIAAGAVHNLVLRADGSVLAWGLNSHGQAQVPSNISNVIAIAAGGYRNSVVLRDGSVVEWGDTSWSNSWSAALMPSGLTNVSMLAAGAAYTIAFGQLLPCITTQPLSQSVFSGNPMELRVGASGTSPLHFQWQHDGNALPGATSSIFTVPAAQQPDAGTYRVLVSNELGETTSADAIVTIVDTAPSTSVSPSVVTTFRGGEFVLNVTVKGSLPVWFQWQKDGTAILGATNATLRVNPVPADGAGDYFVVVTNAFGLQTSTPVAVYLLPTAWWGSPAYGLRNMPVALTNAVALSVRDWDLPTAVALSTDGLVTAWGNAAIMRVPAGLSDVVAVSAGNGFGLALGSTGEVSAWGDNSARQTNIPLGLSEVVAIAAGWRHCLALKRDGTVAAWGANDYKQASPPSDLCNVVGIAAGYAHCAALRSDGTVVCWGINVFGQTNVPGGLAGIVAIAGGGDHTLALKRDGSVVAWGYNSKGQAQVPPGLTNVAAVAAADTYSMALCHDGSLVLWGAPGVVTNMPPGLQGLQGIHAANQSAYALLGNGPTPTFAPPLDPLFDQGVFSVSVQSERGCAYRLEFTDRLPPETWTLGIPLPGMGDRATLFDYAPVPPVRFYSIRRLR